MKKFLSLMIVFIMAFVCCITAFADTRLYAIGSEIRISTLIISGTTATCTSQYRDTGSGVSSIVITQTLEKNLYYGFGKR